MRRLVIHGQAPTLACPTGRSILSAQSAASPFGLLPTMQRSPRTGLILRQWRSQRRNRIPGSSPAAVPLACHSQQSRPVPSGQPRTITKRPRPAPFAILAGDSSTRSGFGSRWSSSRGLHRPCHARPAQSVLVVAQGRSAGGVRDQPAPLVHRFALRWSVLGDLPAVAVTRASIR
jgi:hypothetical protein